MSNLNDFKPEDIFIGADKDVNPLGKETINEFLDEQQEVKSVAPKFTPPNVRNRTREAEAIAQKVASQMTPEKEMETMRARLIDLENTLMKLREGMGDVRVVEQKERKPLDYSKLSEADVFDLDIPIEAIEHEYQDFSEIPLKDPSYIGRWINVHPQRMGPMKAAGFTFVTEEDLERPLGMDLGVDENGQYRWIDVVAMKVPKEKYLRALRTNYLRALAQTQQRKVHQLAQQDTENAMMNGTTEAKAPMGQAVEYQKRKASGEIGIYSPNL